MSDFKRSLLSIREKILKQKSKMTIPEWSDKYRFLSSQASSTPGRWSTSLIEVARGPMLAATDPSVKKITIMGPTQLLKALDIRTPIPTKEGWKSMEDISVGDVVFGPDGKFTNVVHVSEIKHSQKCFEVEFSDGEKIICDAGHRWSVRESISKEFKIKETQEIFNTGKCYLIPSVYFYKKIKERRILNIKEVESVPVKCISVDNESHLYLCGKSFIPTHNTEFLLNVMGYYAHQEPCPILMILPTKDMAETVSKDRIDNMVKDSPEVRKCFNEKKSRDSDNTMFHKKFYGGQLSLVWSNSPSQLSSRPIKIILADEIDKYPASSGKEGNVLALAGERTDTFWDAKQIATCSPTIKGESKIESEYLASDQRIFEIPCPKCGLMSEPLFKNVEIVKEDIKKSCLKCPGCGHKFTERERILAISSGEWRATKPFNGHAGFKTSKLASPWNDIPFLVKKFLDAKKNPESLKVFVNTQLAETWEEKGERPAWEKLSLRHEKELFLGKASDSICVITSACDIQKDRIEVLTVGWTRNMVNHLVDRQIFMGDTAFDKPWNDLDDYLCRPIETTSGQSLPIAVALIDSGYKAQKVYEYCNKYVHSGRVLPIKGFDSLKTVLGTPSAVEYDFEGKKIKSLVKLYPVGSSVLKSYVYDIFGQNFPKKGEEWQRGFFRFPEMDDEFFKQITSEQIIKVKDKNGFIKKVWKKVHERNEALDLYCYNWAAAHILQLHLFKDEQWEKLSLQTRQKLTTISKETKKENKEENNIKKRRKSDNFW